MEVKSGLWCCLPRSCASVYDWQEKGKVSNTVAIKKSFSTTERRPVCGSSSQNPFACARHSSFKLYLVFSQCWGSPYIKAPFLQEWKGSSWSLMVYSGSWGTAIQLGKNCCPLPVSSAWALRSSSGYNGKANALACQAKKRKDLTNPSWVHGK